MHGNILVDMEEAFRICQVIAATGLRSRFLAAFDTVPKSEPVSAVLWEAGRHEAYITGHASSIVW